MKINAIKSLCKKAKLCMIYESDGGRQWIGTKEAIYPADGIALDRCSVAALFDMGEDLEEKLRFDTGELIGSGLLPMEERTGWEEMAEGFPLEYLGEKIIPLATQGELYMLSEERIKPAIGPGEYRTYRLANNSCGEPLIVIDNGLLTAGIVRPLPQGTVIGIQKQMRAMGTLAPCGSPE